MFFIILFWVLSLYVVIKSHPLTFLYVLKLLEKNNGGV